MRNLSIFAIIVFTIIFAGCSGENRGITAPELTIDSSHAFGVGVTDTFPDGSPSGGTGMLGLFNLSIDPEYVTASLEPIRESSLTDVLEVVEITNFLRMAPCTDCARLKSVSIDPEGHPVVSIGIKHPFPEGDPLKPATGRNRGDLHVFNIEGIIISNSEGESFTGIGQSISGLNLFNADGFSAYLDDAIDDFYPTDASIHPYILHFDDYSAGNFSATNPMGFESVTEPPPSGNLVMAMGCDYDYQNYVFNIDTSKSFIYAVGCTYAVSAANKIMRFSPEYRVPQHAKKAASEVSVAIVSNDLKGGNVASTAEIEVRVVDISHGVSVGTALDQMLADSSVDEITIEIPGITSSPIAIDGGGASSGSGHDPSDPLVYPVTIQNTMAAAEGTYTGLVKVLDSYSPGQNTSPLLDEKDGITRVDPVDNPLTGLFAISEFATYQVFSISVAIGKEIALTSPNGGEVWDGFSHHDITWDSDGPIGNVKLEYSKDDFMSDINIISADTENDGIFDWTVPNDPTTTAKVRITEIDDPLTFDISDAAFTINQSIIPVWPYMGCDEKNRCLSTFNGTTSTNIKWTYNQESVCSSPSIGPDGTLYCGIYKPNGSITSPGLVSIDPTDGSQNWMHFPAVGNYYGREPAVSPDGQNVFYGGDGGAGGGYRGRIYKLNTSDGSQVWYYQLSSSITGTYELIDGGIKIGSEGSLYFQSLRPMGIARMWGLNSDGTYRWHWNINGYAYSDMLHHCPAIGSDGYIYITDPGGQLWKFDSTGNSLWSAVYVNYYTKWPGSLDDDNNFYVVCDDGSDVNKFAPDGTQLWVTPQWDFYLHCSPAHDSEGYIYATGGWDSTPPVGYRLRKMNPTNGATIWEYPIHAITTAMMAVSADGYIYIGCGNGSSYGPGLQCWDTDGNLIFNVPLPYQAGSPAIGADGTVYVEANHTLYAIGD
jgi:hypothetical protein